ncbi:hypothetical protein CRYUN_Cryun24cG0023200 [Craigia yunnanensis]
MGRKPCCLKEGVNRGAWSLQEEKILTNYIELHGEGKWRTLPQKAGLNRCGKSCRLRWMNYLRPGIKRGNISREEEDLVIRLHRLLGNRSGSSSPSVIAPKATRCTRILISLHQGKHLMNNQYYPPSSTPSDFDDELMLESKKDNEVQMPNALDYVDLSQARIENIFENSNMLESDLAPMFEMEFENLTSLLGLEDEWRDLL